MAESEYPKQYRNPEDGSISTPPDALSEKTLIELGFTLIKEETGKKKPQSEKQ